jgi:hypothetical protein
MSNSGLQGKQFKYLCTMTGEKSMKPCAGCYNPEGCLSRAMQYKKSKNEDTGSDSTRKSGSKVNAFRSGNPSGDDYEYTTQGKQSDAAPSKTKENPMTKETPATDGVLDDEDELLMKALEETPDVEEYTEDEDDETEEKSEWVGLDDDLDGKAGVLNPSRLRVEEDDPDAVEEEEDAPVAPPAPPINQGPPPAPAPAEGPPPAPAPAEGPPPAPAPAEGPPPAPAPTEREPLPDEEPLPEEEPLPDEELLPDEEKDEEEDLAPYGKKDDAYRCAIDRKVYPGSMSLCDDCPGGCAAEKGMPGLLEIETALEIQFKGTIIDSVYSQDADLYIADLDIEGKSVIEVFVEGQTGEVRGFSTLDNSVFEQKSAFGETDLIDFSEAAEVAVKTIEGSVASVEPDVFEGYDCYAVEINSVDSKSYDVFVALDGEVLGYDAYEPEETASIEAEAAEIALKRAFSSADTEDLITKGLAMQDGSFPIATEEDLRNAVLASARAENPLEAKVHIMQRSHELGLEELIPAEWTALGEKAVISANDAKFMASLVEFEMLSDTENNAGSN